MEGGTRVSIVLGQRHPWPEMLYRAREIESLGFDGLFLVDHFYGLNRLEDPTHESYTMLAALAPFTQTLRLGVMVSGNTYRNPALLLKQAITVDHISGGRVDFGVGAGWLEREHEAYGFPFPSARGRVDRFAEALQVWDLLQTRDRTTFEGEHYQLLDAPFEPKSLQTPRMPLLIGGSGPRMLRLTARHADIWNAIGTPEQVAETNRRLDDACQSEGRDPGSLVRSISPSINLLASVDSFVAGLAAYRDAGFRDIFMPWPRLPEELPILRQVARDVLPSLRNTAASHSPLDVSTAMTLRVPDDSDATSVAVVLCASQTPALPTLMEHLSKHPDTLLDGDALASTLNLASHGEVTRTIAAFGRELALHGIARPWNESQRGYLVDGGQAAFLRSILGLTREHDD